MNRVKKTGLLLLSVFFHLIAGWLIFQFWRPVAEWYWNYRPILGIDFYNTVSYVAYLARDFVLSVNGWKYTWWTGVPFSQDYPMYHAYLSLPFLSQFSLPQAVQAYMMVSVFGYLFFSYLLFAEISRERILALILAVALAVSSGVYGALIMGGSLTYFATQTYLPLSLWLLVKYLNTNNRRWFLLSALVFGLSFLGHVLVGMFYILPMSVLMLFFFPFSGERYISLAKIKRIFSYVGIAFLVGYPQLGIFFGRNPVNIVLSLPSQWIFFYINRLFKGVVGDVSITSGGKEVFGEGAGDIAEFNRGQLARIFTDVQEIFFTLLLVSVVLVIFSFLIRKKRLNTLKALSFGLPALWIYVYILMFSYGISLAQGGWYRMFWALPLALGVFISYAWGDFLASIKERLPVFEKQFILKFVLFFVSGLGALVVGYAFISQNMVETMLVSVENPGYRQQSSAFPDSLNVNIEPQEFEDLKKRLVPSWLDPNNTQYRFYDADQRVNIWWNALYKMPLFKGYIEAHPGDSAGNFYWTAIALTRSSGGDPLVDSWGAPVDMAYNNTLFLIDWFSIKYIEAEHERSDSFNPLTSYVAESDIFEQSEKVVVPGWVQLYLVPEGESLIWHADDEEYLTYYGVKDSLVSPIAHTTDAKTLGIIASQDAYLTVMRDLAAVNLNSRHVLPVLLGKYIDEISLEELNDMDGLLLYSYDYKNHSKAWDRIEQYVESGGKVFIETGSEVKQTDSVNLPGSYPTGLPSLFPISATKKEAMGDFWSLSGNGSVETEGISFSEFGLPELDGEPWLFSLPNSEGDLRAEAKVILSNKGVPIIASQDFGEGEVIWSGMNLPYHLSISKSMAEARLFENLIGDMVSQEPVSYGEYEVERKSSNKVLVRGSGAKGVIFREHSYPGWTARLRSASGSQRLKIYKTGPTYYGFSYVRIPDDIEGQYEVEFIYRGEFWVYFWQVIWFVTVVLIFDKVLTGGKLVSGRFAFVWGKLRGLIGGWWEKEDEE